jgi:uncharacterized membrane protein (TIGR02234 family)
VTGTRGYIAALTVLLAGGVLLLVTSGLTWGEAQAVDRAVPPVVVSGRDVLPVTQAVGLLALAAVVAVHASRRTGRRVVGGLLALAGLGVAAWASLTALELTDHVLRYAAGPAGVGGFSATVARVGPVLAAVGGLLVGAVGVAVMVLGSGWPGMGARYERDRARLADHSTPEQAATYDRDVWNALDRGEDPTA